MEAFPWGSCVDGQLLPERIGALRTIRKQLLSWVGRVIDAIEAPEVPLARYGLSFLAIFALRVTMEVAESGERVDAKVLVHLFTWYAAVVVLLTWVIAKASSAAAQRVIRVVLTCFAIVLLPPVIDLLLSGGAGIKMSYLVPRNVPDLLRTFATFCFTFSSPGASPGIRIEVALVVLSSGLYVWLKRRRLLWALAGALGVYTVVFCYGAFPFLVMASFGRGAMSEDNLTALLFLSSWPFVLWLCSQLQPTAFRAIVRDARPARLAYYCLMLLCGFALARGHSVPAASFGSMTSVLALTNGCLAIVFAGIFSAITNNIEDIPVDIVSNPERPLPSNAVSRTVYHQFAIGALALASIHGLLAGFVMYFCLCVFLGTYWLYSMRPFRLKRLLVLSKAAIAVNSVVLAFAGYAVGSGTTQLTRSLIRGAFDLRLTIYVLVGITLAANLIDLKDTAGDKAAGIRTLPVLLGQRAAQWLLACVLSAFLAFLPFAFHGQVPWAPLAGFALLAFFFVSRRKYDERPLFVVILACECFVLGTLLQR